MSKSIVGVAAVRLLGVVTGFLSVVLLARLLGPEQYGIYAFTLATITLLSLPANTGLCTLLLRTAARQRSSTSVSELRGLWNWTNGTAVAVATTLGVVAWLAINRAGITSLSSNLDVLFASGAALLLLTPLLALRTALLSGLGNVAHGQSLDNIVKPLVFVLLITGVAASSPQAWSVTATQAVLAITFSTAIALIVGQHFLRHSRPRNWRTTVADYIPRQWLRAAWPLTLVGAGHILMRYVDVVMLGFWHSSTEVGIYRATYQLASLATLPHQVAVLAYAPLFAGHPASHDHAGLQRLATRCARLASTGSTPLLVLLLIASSPLLTLFFGDPYRAGAPVLVALCIGQLINVVAGPVGMLLNMSGHEREAALGVWLATLVNLALNALLIPGYGAVGAAVATAVALVVWNVILCQRALTLLNINPTILPIPQYTTR